MGWMGVSNFWGAVQGSDGLELFYHQNPEKQAGEDARVPRAHTLHAGYACCVCAKWPQNVKKRLFSRQHRYPHRITPCMEIYNDPLASCKYTARAKWLGGYAG